MLQKIEAILRLVRKTHAAGTLPYQINDIRAAITQVTNIDQIHFVEFHDNDNPIGGRYERYENAMLGPYQGDGTRVEVHFCSGLNYCGRRHVMCKEMCHAFLDDPSTRVSTPQQIAKLAELLILPDNSREAFLAFSPFTTEKLAEIAAIELLCPIDERKKVVELRAKQEISDLKIATEFRIPTALVREFFAPKYVAFMEKMFEESRQAKA